jgi:hypothetical protein
VTISASAGNARLLLAGVSIATVLLYLRSLGNGWIYDDRLLLVDNREIGKWSYFWKAFVHDEIWFFDPVAASSEFALSPPERRLVCASVSPVRP